MGAISFVMEKIGLAPGKTETVEQADAQAPSGPAFMPFKTQEEAIKFVDDEFVRRQKAKRDYELQWMLNINFLNNNQYVDINPTSHSLYQQDKAYSWQELQVYNQIAPIYETRLAKLKQVKPIPFIRPASSETRDIAAAKSSKSIVSGLDTDLDMSSRRALAIAWTEMTGCCFIKHRWDTQRGNLIGQDEQGPVYEGDINKDIVNPFEIFPDSNYANGIEGCKSIIHARPMPVEDIWDKWGVVVPSKTVDVFTFDQANIGSSLDYNNTGNRCTVTTMDKHEIVKELMLLPCKKYPQGLNIIVAGKKLLSIGPFIYRVGSNGSYGFPYEMLVCIETPGFFWPTSIIERLIPVQRRYNAVKNRKHEMLNRRAIGNLAIEDDGAVDVEDLEEEGLYPGKIHVYARGTHAPVFLSNSDSTADFDTEEAKLEVLFSSISGVSPFSSQALVPSGVTSGDAMERLRESDESRISLTADNIKSSCIKGWKIDLRLYRQFAQGPRLLRYVGKNNEVDLLEWYASDLNSEDIIIDNEDEISQTPAQRMQLIKELLQYKLFSNDVDPKTRNKIMSMLRLANWEDTDNDEELNAIRARRENKMVMEGIPPQIKDFDMHEIHIQEHNRMRLDAEYEDFEKSNPELAAVFDAHVTQHQQIVDKKAAAMAAQMNPPKGPAESINYKDVPAVGQIQMLKQAGIEISTNDVMDQKLQELNEKAAHEASKAVIKRDTEPPKAQSNFDRLGE